MNKSLTSKGKKPFLSKSLPWAWHPILGLVVLFLPETLVQSLASLLDFLNVHSMLPAVATLSSRSDHSANVYSYLSINWLLLPVWTLTIVYLTRHKSPQIKNAKHALMLITGALLVGGLTFLFFAIKFPTSTPDVPMSRGFALLYLLESSRFGLWIVIAAVTGLCAMFAAGIIKIIQWFFQHAAGVQP
jgi:membrane-associated HD superfamily phosphohydrolase